MEVKLIIEIHTYCEESLCDEVLDFDSDLSCVLEPEDLLLLRKNRKCQLLYKYSEITTLKDVIDTITCRIQFEYAHIAFLSKNERFFSDDDDANFNMLVKKYLDPNNEGEINVQALVCLDAGDICREDGLRYYMYSHEAGKHHKPHVHVSDTSHQYEASLALSDGSILDGYLPRKLLKKAQEKIDSDRNRFEEWWCTKTDGLSPDINRHYGYIDF